MHMTNSGKRLIIGVLLLILFIHIEGMVYNYASSFSTHVLTKKRKAKK